MSSTRHEITFGRAMIAAAAVMAAAPQAAAAQSAEELQGCVAAAGGSPVEQVAADCSNRFYQRCHAKFANPTTIDYTGCMDAGYRGWDALLNALWGPIKARAQADGTWDGVLNDQRAWISVVEAECQLDPQAGSIGGIEVLACRRDLTARRAVEFQRSLDP